MKAVLWIAVSIALLVPAARLLSVLFFKPVVVLETIDRHARGSSMREFVKTIFTSLAMLLVGVLGLYSLEMCASNYHMTDSFCRLWFRYIPVLIFMLASIRFFIWAVMLWNRARTVRVELWD